MPKINKVSWAKVKVDNQTYHQVIIIGDQVLEREKGKLDSLFGTTHEIGDWEQALLLSQEPEIVLIANGWNGVLKVKEAFKKKVTELGVELRVILTPKVVKEYNRLVKEGKKVNVLIHTTC